jgi:hypothetical protein
MNFFKRLHNLWKLSAYDVSLTVDFDSLVKLNVISEKKKEHRPASIIDTSPDVELD